MHTCRDANTIMCFLKYYDGLHHAGSERQKLFLLKWLKSTYPFMHLSICLSIHPSFHLSMHPLILVHSLVQGLNSQILLSVGVRSGRCSVSSGWSVTIRPFVCLSVTIHPSIHHCLSVLLSISIGHCLSIHHCLSVGPLSICRPSSAVCQSIRSSLSIPQSVCPSIRQVAAVSCATLLTGMVRYHIFDPIFQKILISDTDILLILCLTQTPTKSNCISHTFD